MYSYNNEFLKNKKILITGGTGTFGQALTKLLLKQNEIKKIYIYSRDELKQFEMKNNFNSDRLQFLIGDIRDKERLYRACNGINYIIHAAAQKHVPSCEYNPFEAIKTNIIGASNVIDSAIDNNVEKVIALSTDKAVEPVNLYGNTKSCMENIFISGNSYVGERKTRLSIVRYGNVICSRGSIIEVWNNCIKNNLDFPLTDNRMTRFWITKKQAVNYVLYKLSIMNGAEIFIPKLPSMKVIDLAKCLKSDCKFKDIGIRPGEKLHETLLSKKETNLIYENDDSYTILPRNHELFSKYSRYYLNDNSYVRIQGLNYSSNTNFAFLTIDEMRNLLND